MAGVLGPEEAWMDDWTDRWIHPNSKILSLISFREVFECALSVFAHQGYFTVAINPTGSTTFGHGTEEVYHCRY
jgi:hypothetical protein